MAANKSSRFNVIGDLNLGNRGVIPEKVEPVEEKQEVVVEKEPIKEKTRKQESNERETVTAVASPVGTDQEKKEDITENQENTDKGKVFLIRNVPGDLHFYYLMRSKKENKSMNTLLMEIVAEHAKKDPNYSSIQATYELLKSQDLEF